MKEPTSAQAHLIDNSNQASASLDHSARVIAITSGKGGVGKTNLATNLGIALASNGSKVCLFDADTNLANINIMLGITPEYTIEHVLNGEKTIDEIIIDGPKNIKIVPAASGIADCVNMDEKQKEGLVSALKTLEDRFDYILVDTAAGVGDQVLNFIQSAQYVLMVISQEPTSLTDAFALIKILNRRGISKPIFTVINMVSDYSESIEVFKRFNGAVDKYLQTRVGYLGYIVNDEAVKDSIRQQQPVILHNPNASSSNCFFMLSDNLKKQLSDSSDKPHQFSSFWKKLSSYSTGLLAQTSTESTSTHGAVREPFSLTALSSNLLGLFNNNELSAKQTEEFITPLINVYIEKYKKFPFNTIDTLIRSLEMENRSENEIRELASIIEAHFDKHFKKPLHENEEIIPAPKTGSEPETIQQLTPRQLVDSLLQSIKESDIEQEDELRKLLTSIDSVYNSHFKRPLHENVVIIKEPDKKPQPEKEKAATSELINSLQAAIQENDFTRDDFNTLIDKLNHLYNDRFGGPFHDKKSEILESFRLAGERINQQEAFLVKELNKLSRALERAKHDEIINLT